jgi:hypothetical protein
MMEMKIEVPIKARDLESVGKRRHASLRAGRSDADTGTGLKPRNPSQKNRILGPQIPGCYQSSGSPAFRRPSVMRAYSARN